MNNTAVRPIDGLRPGVLWAVVIAGVWVISAVARPETTLHLGPLLVPLVPAVVMDGSRRTYAAVLIAASIGLVATVVLAATGNLDGPALNPFPDALVESLVFLGVGTATGVGVVALRRADAGQ